MVFPIQYSFMIPFILLGLFIFYIYRGIHNGLMYEIVATLSLLVAVIIAWYISFILKDTINIIPDAYLDTPVVQALEVYINQILWFFVLLLGLLIIRKVFGSIMKRVNDIVLVGFLNQVAGAIFAGIKGLIVIILCIVLLSSPLFTNGRDVMKAAHLMPIHDVIHKNVPVARDVIDVFDKIEIIRTFDADTIEEILK